MLKHRFKFIMIVACFMFILAGCGSSNSNGNETGEKKEDKSLKLAYVAWDSEIASTNVVKYVLEEKLGYDVEMLQVDAGPMWAGVSDGSADAMVAAWLPYTHKDYYSKNEGKFDDLGQNLDGAKLGLVVPEYVDLNSVEDLAKDDTGKAFDYTIIGIEPGAGLMSATETALNDYGLKDKWTLLESSSAAMATQLQKAYDKKEPIIVTGWTPHWMFAKMDLKYLDDPKGSFGATEQIHTIARKGLKEDHPAAYKFLDQFAWTTDDMAAVMVDIVEGTSPEDAAAKWVEANNDKMQKWLEGVQ